MKVRARVNEIIEVFIDLDDLWDAMSEEDIMKIMQWGIEAFPKMSLEIIKEYYELEVIREK